MKTKQLLYMLCVLVALVAAITIYDKVINRAPSKSELLLFPKYDVSKVAVMECSDKDSTAVVKKINGRWVVPASDNYRADSTKVSYALKCLVDLEKQDIVSNNPRKFSLYGLDSTGVWRILMKGADGEVLVSVWLGNYGASNMKQYIRLDGSDEVMCISYPVKKNFYVKNSDWMDRKIWPEDKDNVQSFAIDHDTVHMAVAKNDSGKWTVQKPYSAPAESITVANFIESLTYMETDSWFGTRDDSSAGAFAKPMVTVTVTDLSGKSQALIVGKKKDTNFFAKISDDTTLYALQEYRFRKCMKLPKDFEKQKPADPSKAESPKARYGKKR